MRSGGVVGTVQEKAAWYRKPVPTRYSQPLSQGLTALPAPLTQGSQALRGTKDGNLIAGVSAETPGGTAKRAARDLTGGTMFLP